MSSDEEEFDIGSELIKNQVSSDDESNVEDSDSDSNDVEIQDEIISSEEEEEEEKEKEQPSKKKQKLNNNKNELKVFPSLEIDDDRDASKAHDEDMYFINQEQQAQQGKNKSKGNFASFGLNKVVLSNITKKGYRQPTPIQRKTIPLILQGRDVVGMARTGSGKTAAFLLPLIEQLKTHSAKIGVRAIVLSPSRELALQTHKQLKEFSKGTGLRSLLLIGGDSMEDQFGAMISNPDVIVATPGRFLHLKVEMRLELKTVEYIVYDEADRLFEMGFAEQLNELLASLPEKRQSLLFSATLPKNLVDFAKAGLFNPVLVRLDAETKISENLELSFFSCKRNEREANLLSILQDVIKIPMATKEQLSQIGEKYHDDSDDEDSKNGSFKSKSKFKKNDSNNKPTRLKSAKATELPSEHSTIIFVPTRHHVEYITNILKSIGYPVAYIYGSLDQHARRRQLLLFRAGVCSILVVTDVAARGIDIPVLANVINYTLPSSSKIFVHRVGRTARAGNKGWAYSIVSEPELPYLLDLEIFLGKKVLLTKMHEKKFALIKQKFIENNGSDVGFEPPKIFYTKRLVIGSIPRVQVEDMEELYELVLSKNYDVTIMRGVCEKAEKLYMRSRQPASQESLKRAKELVNVGWEDQHLLFGKNLEEEKDNFLAKLQNRKNKETVFEFGKRDEGLIDLMNKRRKQIATVQEKHQERRSLIEKERMLGLSHTLEDEILRDEEDAKAEVGFNINEEELLNDFEDGDELLKKDKKKTFKDPTFYMPHYAPKSHYQDQQLAIGDGGSSGNFVSAASNATFDIDANDDKVQVQKQTVVWDKKKGRYIKNQDDRRYIISESGQRILASYRSGKFDDWKQKHNVKDYKVGALEKTGSNNRFENNLNGGKRGGRMMYKGDKAPKMPHKGRDDYHRQMDKVKKANDRGLSVKGFIGKGGAKNELRSADDIRKQREIKEKKKAKNARPSKKRRR
ncbi:putative ATP-dependent RNA helicase [Martiniozyma asiatica (nom. inval.)]|nr:putative ATP-dependent RNA helicase [Martiniozyma asiatica]